MDFLQIYFIALGLIIILISLLWLLSLALKDSSIVDIFWGTGFVILSLAYFAMTVGDFERKGLLVVLVMFWGLRLSLYLAKRNLGKGEDFRYQTWRKESGKSWWWQSFFKVFLLQGLLLWFISMPLLGAQFYAAKLNWLDYLAALIWLIGFIFEAGGDWQLMNFRANPDNKGKVLDTGFWRYTRHLNYFGDAAQCWGFYLFAVAAGAWWTILSPLLMTFLLLRISGVVMLEKSLKKTKPEYADYVKRTSAFFPLPPKKSS
jgi:steroid 5-alpha reductase family enzyme